MKTVKKDLYWFVTFPTYQYNEDVIELAHKNHLEIVDAIFKDSTDKKLAVSDKDAPELTVKGAEKVNNKGTVGWYKEELTKLEVEFDDSATKGELTAIYEDATAE